MHLVTSKNLRNSLRLAAVKNRVLNLLEQNPSLELPQTSRYRLPATSHNLRHASYMGRLIDASVRDNSSFNPTEIAAYQDVTSKRDLDLLKKWVDTKMKYSHKGYRLPRRYTPREEEFITEAQTAMYQARYSPEENGLKEIVEEIRYAALMPTSKFTFKDKHGWEPSEMLLHDCSLVLAKMARYRKMRREKDETRRKRGGRLKLRKLSQTKLSEGTGMKVESTALWKVPRVGELEEVDYYNARDTTLGEVEKEPCSSKD
ncbi:hypothetical protein GLAREA_05967 [Glarea lozoyensis ATCC 20868]|uniref:Uncharacterized protein n=1 Tax=Glarea lozoyensis (strain ATCC 20868 / MF5171) TaxID=1116229 RepID=S3D599_GLAL2|nr:uncharacterized protein GLAREA_05967 [Glarea lozoyensis ATCC 20868]EPE32955.1 hypothetical protein GLAREA_05967 [Glarea lozoyensis ATCC 20868]